MSNNTTNEGGVVDVSALHFPGRDEDSEAARCRVVEEDALTLRVQDVGNYTLMWTPTTPGDRAQGYTLEDGLLGDVNRPEGLCLALGFAVSEGLVRTLEDIHSLSLCPDEPGVVLLQLKDPGAVSVNRRDVVIDSSCGICGPREILEDNALQLENVGASLKVDRSQLEKLMSDMRADQRIFDETGGSHGAAIFDGEGTLLAVAEDLGRHNAMDKAIGIALLNRRDLRGCGVVLSSRVSLELVLKAIRTGLEIMIAVSAPTSLAIEVADKFGVTLCGFVRDSRATVYSHPQRING